MAFPTTVARTNNVDSVATMSHTINIPDGSNVAGRLIVAVVGINSTGANSTGTWPGGWVALVAHAEGSDSLELYYHETTGLEGYPATGASITVTTPANRQSAHATYLFSGQELVATQPPQVGTSATGSSAAPNPPLLTPTGGAKDYTWLAVGGMRDTTFSAAPASYTNLQAPSSGAGGSATAVGAAERQLNAASEDPGTFTTANNRDWVANTIVIHPSSAVAGGQQQQMMV